MSIVYLSFPHGIRKNPHVRHSERLWFPAKMLAMSDIHVFADDCLAEDSRNMIKCVRMEEFIADGDYLDFLSKNYISAKELGRYLILESDNDQIKLVKTVRGLPRLGVKSRHLIGNHGRALMDLIGDAHPKYDVQIAREYIYETAHGDLCLFLHGDIFDTQIRFQTLLEKVGTHAFGQLSKTCLALDRASKNATFRTVLNTIGLSKPWEAALLLKKRVDALTFNKMMRELSLQYMFLLNQEIDKKHKEEGHPSDQPPRPIKYVACGHSHIPDRYEGDEPYYQAGRLVGRRKAFGFNMGYWTGPVSWPDNKDETWRDHYPIPCTALIDTYQHGLDLVRYDPRKNIASYYPPPMPKSFNWSLNPS